MNGPQANWLADGKRLHLNHGPIDLIVEAFGEVPEVQQAYRQAVARFQTVLGELVEELTELRKPASTSLRAFAGPTAQCMEAAVSPLAERFITPMAAVAGSVADEIMAAMLVGRQLDRAYINNGGDIALHLAAGQSMKLAIAGTGHGFADRVEVQAEDAVRGIATSGWRGRSFSFGIADAVTVLAQTGAAADAAATLIANAVDLPGHPAILRQPARELAPDSDLGERLVTTDVGSLSASEVAQALEAGLGVAEDFRRRGLIEGAALFLNGESRVCGEVLRDKSAPRHTPLCPAGHLPHKRGDRPAAPISTIATAKDEVQRTRQPISPLVGEMSGRTEGGNVKRGASQKSTKHLERPHA